MVGWHHQLNRHGFGWTPGAGDGQGGLACGGSWGRKETQLTEYTELNCISDSFVDYDGYSISSKGFLPTVADMIII